MRDPEELSCAEMSSTQMVCRGPVSSYGELKDAFREEGGRKQFRRGPGGSRVTEEPQRPQFRALRVR